MSSEEPVAAAKQDEMKEIKDKEPKNPNTSFIHKLYAMLEDHNLDHLIWWHANQSSFYVLPSEEFTRVLSNYFKHANIASFIRQLNMYGFHKVNDNFNNETLTTTPPPSDQTGSRKGSNSSNNSSYVWEFKHSSGWFRQGNTEGLTQIKRRSFKNVSSQKEVHSLKLPQTEGMKDAQNYVPYRYHPSSPGDLNDVTMQEEMDMKARLTNSYVQQQMSTTMPPKETNYLELTGQYHDLLRAYDALTYRYEIVKEDLTKTNYDCVSLLDVLKDVVGLIPKEPANEMMTTKLLSELEKFKTNVLQRCAARDMAFKQVTNGLGHYGESGSIFSDSHGSLAVPINTPHTSLSHIPQPPPRNSSATSSFHPYDQSQLPYKDIRYSGSSNRPRNVSVFDPLQPATPSVINTGPPPPPPGEQSPAILSQMHETDMSHQSAQQPMRRNSPAVMPFLGSPGPVRRSSPGPGNPPPPLIMQTLSGVPGENAKTRSSSANSLSYLQNTAPAPTGSPTNNLKRAGSMPSQPVTEEKRSSQTYSLTNPPRSIPSQLNQRTVHEHQQQQTAHQSRTNSSSSASATSVPPLQNTPSTTVYSLLNPPKGRTEEPKRESDVTEEIVKRIRSQ
ncbi:hypothetical protein KL909_005279 [Ogataea angusta]|nr:hypothetical protein KL909_005279 [Ogataea angusta]